MRTRPIRDLALALTLLTALPIDVSVPPRGERRDVACWFPFVGLVFGIVVAGVSVLAHRLVYGLSPTGAVLMLAALAALTRFLHWDGLADVADGWFVEPDRRLTVMDDPRVGAFGATAVAFFAIAQVNALVELASTPQGAALALLAPLFGRSAATFAAWLGKPIRPGGLGSSVMGSPTVLGLLVALSSLMLGAVIAYWWGAAILSIVVGGAVSLLVAAVVPHFIALRFGGVNGDVMGASIVVTETTVYVLLAAVLAALRLGGLTP